MAAVTEGYTVTPASFPARSKTASSSINGKETTATSISFSDKILITVTQEGRLAHWVSLSEMLLAASLYGSYSDCNRFMYLSTSLRPT